MNMIYIMIFTILIISCSKNSIVDTNSCIDINISKSEFKDQIAAMDLFNSLWNVQLETNDESLINNIDRLYAKDSLLYILDNKQDAILIFNINGKYINKINNKGAGPNEYIGIDDAFINNRDEFVICDIARHKMMFYSLYGNFLREEDNPLGNENFYCMDELADNSLIYYLGQKNTYDKVLKEQDAIIITKDKKIIPLLKQTPGELKFKIGPSDSYFLKSKQQNYLHVPFHNEIYEISNKKIILKYKINVLDKMLPKEAFFSPNNEYFMDKYLKSANYICLIGSIKSSSNQIIIPTLNGMNFFGNIWVSKETNKVKASKKIVTKDNQTLNLIAICTKGDTVICINGKGIPDQSENNPVLIMYTMKNF